MNDEFDMDDETPYALTWHGPEGRLYWSLTKGWVDDPDKAWVLIREEVDSIEDDERLFSKLPQFKERKETAQWEPLFMRFTKLRPGVTDDAYDYDIVPGYANDDDDEPTFNSTGD